MKILIVDDEPSITMLGKLLIATGYPETKVVHTPDDALQELSNNTPDVALLDIDLNDKKMNGIDLLKWIKQNKPQVKVCMSSAYVDEHRQTCMGLGAECFLGKPSRLEDLKKMLKTLAG